MRAGAWLTALSLCLGSARGVQAHAAPKALGIHWGPVDDRVIVQTNRGLIVQGSQASFRLLCNEAYRSPFVEVPPVALTPHGRALVGTYAGGIMRSSLDLCDFDVAAGPIAGLNTVDLQVGPGSTFYALYALTLPADGSTARVWTSDDDGSTWSALADIDGAATSLRLSSGPSPRLYALSTESQGTDLLAHVGVSSDGGRTFARHTLLLEETEVRAYLLGVDPSDARRVFVRTETFDGVTAERLLQSRDGGESFDLRMRAEGPLVWAASPDGETMWIGGAAGLWRSRDHGDTFESVAMSGLNRISCLSVHGDRLYACGDKENRFGVFVSSDGGNTFDWFLHFTDVEGRVDCAARTSEGATCQVPYADWSVEQPHPLGDGGAAQAGDAGANASDADARIGKAGRDADGTPAPLSGGGCAVVTGGASPDGSSARALVAALLTLVARRQRRRRAPFCTHAAQSAPAP